MKNRTMLNTILSVVMTASMLACANQKNGTSASVDAVDTVDKESSMNVSLSITISSDYCGGAAPSEKVISKLNEPKQFTNQKLYITTTKPSKILPEDMTQLTSSTSGTIDTSLEKGTYFVFLPEKVSAKLASKDRSESDCIKWKNTPNGTFTVGSDKNISFNIHKTCDGCGALRM